MNYLQTIILAVVEGITEFLPVSSTFHLIQVSKLISLQQTEFIKLFEVVIQTGAASALFFLFAKEIWLDQRRYLKLFVSTIPAMILGFLLHNYIKDVLFVAEYSTTIVFIVVGVAFILVEFFVARPSRQISRSLSSIDYAQAFIIGLIQSLALVPGVSRSGSVITGMLLMGYARADAAVYSLALSVPTLFAASGYDLFKFVKVNGIMELSKNLDILVLGFIGSFIAGYFASRWLLKYLQSRTLRVFGIYRIVAGIILLAVSYWFAAPR
ncbi:MAG: undecaprenyl-diphosphate phosphatase [Candidatus Roizmanbacteria bacterium]